MARKMQTPAMAWVLRIFILLNLISTLGFIIYAIILQNPPKSALPLGLLIIGIIGAVTALVGILGSCCHRTSCMTLYIIMAVLVTLAELGITLSLFFDADKVVQNLAKSYNDPPTQDDINSANDKVTQGRWFFLVVVILQAISLIVGLVLRICIYPRARDFENFEGGEGPPLGQVQMEELKHSVTNGRPSGLEASASYAASKKMSRSVSKRVEKKYGAWIHDPSSVGGGSSSKGCVIQ